MTRSAWAWTLGLGTVASLFFIGRKSSASPASAQPLVPVTLPPVRAPMASLSTPAAAPAVVKIPEVTVTAPAPAAATAASKSTPGGVLEWLNPGLSEQMTAERDEAVKEIKTTAPAKPVAAPQGSVMETYAPGLNFDMTAERDAAVRETE